MKRKLWSLGLLAVCFIMAASMANAAACGGIGNTIFSTTTGGNGTMLTGLVSPASSSCTLGAYTFSDWELAMVSGFTGTSNSFSMSFGPGTGVSGGVVTLDFGFTGLTSGEDIRLFYSITPGVTTMTLNVSGTGTASVGETICSVSNAPTDICSGTVLANFSAGASGTATSTVTFAAEDWVGKDISAGANGTLSEFSQVIVPEPMTLTLLGAGLLGLGALGRRRLRK